LAIGMEGRSAGGASPAVRPAEFVQLGVVADASGERSTVPRAAGAVCPRSAGLTLAERVGVIEIDLPDGVRVRVDSSVNEKALRRVLAALRGSG
jgi:transposase